MSEIFKHMKCHKTKFKETKDTEFIDEVVKHITNKDIKDVMKLKKA
ncbi:MAG: hypothetical protein KAJ47_01140 [Candidatus Aenigmarchaeota archaeon]|nr:hypothetical protein [Candidatus Aenigmarchaeota archaeon]